MPTGSTGYPGVVDVFEAIQAEAEFVGPDVVDHAAALNAIEAELGINPSGASATVVERLDAIAAVLGVPNDGSVTLAKLAAAIKPSGSAAAADEAVRRLGTGATHAAAGDDARFPTTGQKNALAGTAGTPGTGNEYATKQSLDLGATQAELDAVEAAHDARLDSVETSRLLVKDEKINVEDSDYGASPGATNAANRAAIQAAIDVVEAAPTKTRKLFFPRLYRIDSTPLHIQKGQIWEAAGTRDGHGAEGAGVRTASGNLVKLGAAAQSIGGLWFRDILLESESGGGHIFAPEFVGSNVGLGVGGGENCQLVQNNAAKSIWHQTDGLYVDVAWRDCIQQHVAGATVPAWYLTMGSQWCNEARWVGGRCINSGEYFFHVEATSGWQTQPVWRDINFEVTEGGNIKCLGVWKPIIDGCVTWDLVTSTRDLYYLGSDGGDNVRYPSISNIDRYGSTLGAGKKDIKCHDVQGGVISNPNPFSSCIIDLVGVQAADPIDLIGAKNATVENYVGRVGLFSPPTPDKVSPNLKLWLKADALTTLSDGDAVGTWTDSAGVGDYIQGTAGNKPTFKANVLNGKPVVRFDGGDYLEGAAVSTVISDSAMTFFAVFLASSLTAADPSAYLNHLLWGDLDNYVGVFLSTSLGGSLHNYDGTYDKADAAGVAQNLWTRLQGRHESGNLYAKRNDAAEASAASGNTAALTAVGRIGKNPNSVYFQGDLAELIIYNAALTSGQRTEVDNYLRAKYAL